MNFAELEMQQVLVLFRKYIVDNITEDLKIEFEELKLDQPIENCFMVFPVYTNSPDIIKYWKVSPDQKLSKRLQDYFSECFEKAKYDQKHPMV